MSRIWSYRLFLLFAILTVGLDPTGAFPAGSQEVKVAVGEGRNLTGTLFTPPSPGPAPAVLVLHASGGLQQADLSYASDLADAGFVSLAVRYYPNPQHQGFRQGFHLPGYIEDLARVVDYLRGRPEVQGQPAGVVGFSIGPLFGVSLAAYHSGVKAVVGYYGAYDLRTLPQTKGALWMTRRKLPPMPVDVAAQVGAPVLLLHGEWDDETPLSQAESMRDALLNAGKVVELVVYPRAYHRFDRGPRRIERTREGYTYLLDEEAKQDAWNRTVSWFRKYLSTAP